MGKTKTAFVGETAEASSPEGRRPGGKRHKKGEPKKVHIAGLKGGQRIKIVEAEPPAEDTKVLSEKGTKKEKKTGKAKTRGRRYKELLQKVNRNKLYSLPDAISLVKETSYSKFDGTMEMHLVVKKVGSSVQAFLPHSAGREKKIEIASDETIEKLQNNKIDFDILLATAEMMPKLVPFAKILGPKGLMPNPKNGTLIKSEKDAGKFTVNALTLKTEKEAPLIHTTFGKVSQKDKELEENAQSIIEALGGTKQIVKAYVKSTMSPSVRLSL